ncbi:MAG: NUDIX hydrolase [Patescibacteria group bacterium]
MRKELPPDEYYKTLARVATSGGGIIRNARGEFLIQKHSYRKDWHIAGGMTNEKETPREAVLREIKEETGLDIKTARLFCVDFAHNPPFDRILFVFDCGFIDEKLEKEIRIDGDEITEFKFVSREEMLEILSPKLITRLKNSLHAFDNGSLVYLEDGIEIK